MTTDKQPEPVLEVVMVTCRLCLGSGRIATGPWGINPSKITCPECNGKRELPEDHHYEDDTI